MICAGLSIVLQQTNIPNSSINNSWVPMVYGNILLGVEEIVSIGYKYLWNTYDGDLIYEIILTADPCRYTD